MKADVNRYKTHADGYVFGILDDERKVDVARTAALVEMAKPLPCTFHKAFDEAPDAFEAIEDVISAGCKTVLTSGGASSAYAGSKTLGQLVRMSRERITIMPGGSVRASNIAQIRAYTRASIFHSSAVPKSTTTPSGDEIRALKMLLNENSTSLTLAEQSPSPTETHSSEDDESVSDMLMSAVSIGASPAEHCRHRF